MTGAAGAAVAIAAAIAFVTWMASVVRHDASLVDRSWPLMIVGAGWASALMVSGVGDGQPVAGTAGGGLGIGLRGTLVLAVATAWALRLSLYITWRNWGHGEDRRYREIRERHEPGFALKSLVLIFALQAFLACIVSMPIGFAVAGSSPFGWLDAAGLALAVFGLVFEAVGDAQMARFKADPGHRGQVMDRGLWAWTRHPNYFGEACVWWGFALVACSAAGLAGAWSLASPVLMTVLLLKVSGVSLLERDIGERRPAYRDYIRRTPAFWPMPPGRFRHHASTR